MPKNTVNKSTPFFSVVIPVYNKGPHIAESIDSVLKQSFSDFELILVDDSSTDNSLSVIRTFQDKRISLYHRDQPGPGGYAARNLGIKMAKASWIAFLDADDIWERGHLQLMHELILAYPETFIVGCGWIYRNGKTDRKDPFYLSRSESGNCLIDLKSYLRSCIKKQQPIWTSVACVNKKSPLTLNLFPDKMGIKRGGDVYAWLSMLSYHKKMAWSNHIGAIYKLDSTNMVTKTSEASPKIAGKNVFSELSQDMDREEKQLLAMYLNRILKHEWFISIKLQKNSFNIRKYLYWKQDFPTSLKYALISYFPKLIIREILFRGE